MGLEFHQLDCSRFKFRVCGNTFFAVWLGMQQEILDAVCRVCVFQKGLGSTLCQLIPTKYSSQSRVTKSSKFRLRSRSDENGMEQNNKELSQKTKEFLQVHIHTRTTGTFHSVPFRSVPKSGRL